jgi:hypothetical protein
MLRLFVLILVLANGVYFLWTSGTLGAYGFAPVQQSEPHRVAQQIKPDALKLLTPAEVSRVEAMVQADLAPKECVQAGPFEDVQVQALRRILEPAWPAGAWVFESVQVPPRWIIYMGRYPNAEMLVKKRAELSALKLTIEALQNPALEFGLSLGGFDNQAAANEELARFNQRGIRTATVVQERVGGTAAMLKSPAASESFKTRLNELKPAMAGKSFGACTK